MADVKQYEPNVLEKIVIVKLQNGCEIIGDCSYSGKWRYCLSSGGLRLGNDLVDRLKDHGVLKDVTPEDEDVDTVYYDISEDWEDVRF